VDVIVVGSKARWARELLASLPPKQRPPVIAIGNKTRAWYGLVDGWLALDAAPAQVARCFATVRGEAQQRIESGETALLDSETGLPSWEALLSALVRRTEWARAEKAELSVVVVQVAGELAPAAAILVASTRRTEITARAGADKIVTLVNGGWRSAERVRARFIAKLNQAGIGAEATSRQLGLANAVADLVYATDAVSLMNAVPA
jgi:GGDEF domain-containing protein